MTFFSAAKFFALHEEDLFPGSRNFDYCEVLLDICECLVAQFLCRDLRSLDAIAISKVEPIVFRLAVRMHREDRGLNEDDVRELTPFKGPIIISLELFKAHLGTDDLLDGDALGGLTTNTDALLLHYLEVAESRVVAMLGRPLSEFHVVPADIKQAVLQLAAHFFEFRQDALVGGSANALPHGVTDLLRPYRVEVTGYVRT